MISSIPLAPDGVMRSISHMLYILAGCMQHQPMESRDRTFDDWNPLDYVGRVYGEWWGLLTKSVEI